MKDLLIQQWVYKVLLGNAKKPQNVDDNEGKEMDIKATGAIYLNLSNKLIHNMIDEEKAEIRVCIWQKFRQINCT